MLNDFPTQYADLSDEELLQVASDRGSLTDDATVALDAEMQKRHLTREDLITERFVKPRSQREARRTRRKLFGNRRDRESWVDGLVTAFWSVLVFALVWVAYIALPQRYHFPRDWEEAAGIVMFSSVFLAVAGGFWWRKAAFWIALGISSAIHVLLIHIWITRVGTLWGHRPQGQFAILLGIILFFVVYGCGFQLRRTLYGREAGQGGAAAPNGTRNE